MISQEIIPYGFYFIILIFFLASMKSVKQKKVEKIKLKNPSEIFDQNAEEFLLDSEKKLKALKELFLQNLISKELYLKKTEQIGIVVNKIIGKDVYEFAKKKNEEIIEDLKGEIFRKIDTSKTVFNNDVNIDKLLTSVDSKIDSKNI